MPQPALPRLSRLTGALLLAAGGLLAACQSAGRSAASPGPVDWPAERLPGRASAHLQARAFTLENDLLCAEWETSGGRLHLRQLTDKGTNRSLAFDGLADFSFETSAGHLDARQFTLAGPPELVELKADPQGIRLADRIAGRAVRARLTGPGMEILWQAELRDGSNYVRQLFTLRRLGDGPAIELNALSPVKLPGAYAPQGYLGTVPGSPYAVAGSRVLAAIEQPGYWAQADGPATALSMPAKLAFGAGDQYQLATLLGIFPPEQRRRSFLYYLERERASPSRPFLHYNAWYDLGFNLSDKTLSPVFAAYERELVKKRGVKLDGFVLDDGWDNPNAGLWKPDPGRFPQGFATLSRQLAASSGTKLGVWISPCGGYGGQAERLALVKRAGGEPAEEKKLDLGYPGYCAMYRDICSGLIKNDGVTYFKWDNAAPFENGGNTFGNLQSTAHFMRLCQIATELRRDNPDLFINATVGTWPSPFWLNHVDCTWRMGGPDVSWTGKGDLREQGMNYRDGEVHRMVVKRAPLYPLSSMMFHGVVLGHHFQAANTSKAGNHMTGEFRSYFALGTNLQELYLSPDLMDAKAWDDLADSVRWSRRHTALLTDSHWVQGDPLKGEPYAYAAWRRDEGVLCLRNPDDQPRTITLDIGATFELPAGAARRYRLTSPYPDQRLQSLDAQAGAPLAVELRPFEVLVFDAKGR